jgi:type I restriction enzyme S subunit
MTRVTRKIKDVISEVKSGDWGKDSPTENYTTDVLCVRGADIPELCKGNVGKMPQRFIHNKKATSKILSANNLIIEISGGSPTQSTGRIALISDKILSRYSKPLICSNFCKAITATGIQPEYLFNYWLYLYNKDAMFSYENGTTGIKNLDFNSFIQEQDISIPDIKTQQKIVSILSSIDEKIETNKRINDNLEEQAKALFKSWFVDFEPFKNGPFADSELGKIPQGWTIGTLSDVGDVIGGGTPSKAVSEYYTNEGIAWITPRDLSTNNCKFISRGETDISELGYKNSNAKLMPRGSILFSSRAPIGYISIAKNEICTNQGFKSIVPQKAGTCFIYYFLRNNTSKIESMASGSTFKEASGGLMKLLKVIIPTKEILTNFEKAVQPLFDMQENNEDESIRLSVLRDTLLPKLMSGELSVEEVSFD